ncbi:transcription initiation factor TFIID subunit 12 [Anthonomus grandis grandis]|uniref:transcription initiation factor TFIID subunit 12 n=1 Tax=Anthonomus grandis grandis TaxID=2921223 RepID=UPI0021653C28|nr:transcription initiation factor TFIID subunit 12 [Anthonomus grandis grandis]
MQNNLQQQNTMVNQMPVGHLQQNNGVVGNSMLHENQMVQQNMVEPQQVQGVQTIHQTPVPQQNHTPNSIMMPKTSQHISSNNTTASVADAPQVVTKQRLQDLVKEIDSTLNLEDEVEEILLSYVDEFVDRCLNGAALIAKNRHCNSIEVKDVQQFLNRNYNMWTPGFGTDELKPYKRSLTTEAHKQRTALIRKTLKKY